MILCGNFTERNYVSLCKTIIRDFAPSVKRVLPLHTVDNSASLSEQLVLPLHTVDNSNNLSGRLQQPKTQPFRRQQAKITIVVRSSLVFPRFFRRYPN